MQLPNDIYTLIFAYSINPPKIINTDSYEYKFGSNACMPFCLETRFLGIETVGGELMDTINFLVHTQEYTECDRLIIKQINLIKSINPGNWKRVVKNTFPKLSKNPSNYIIRYLMKYPKLYDPLYLLENPTDDPIAQKWIYNYAINYVKLKPNRINILLRTCVNEDFIFEFWDCGFPKCELLSKLKSGKSIERLLKKYKYKFDDSDDSEDITHELFCSHVSSNYELLEWVSNNPEYINPDDIININHIDTILMMFDIAGVIKYSPENGPIKKIFDYVKKYYSSLSIPFVLPYNKLIDLTYCVINHDAKLISISDLQKCIDSGMIPYMRKLFNVNKYPNKFNNMDNDGMEIIASEDLQKCISTSTYKNIRKLFYGDKIEHLNATHDKFEGRFHLLSKIIYREILKN